ncbi:hypothetical protein Goshw_016315, partial [Gossypium schwendimanii]|nr:hypothetical protein [Gossypium schwendimanii]
MSFPRLWDTWMRQSLICLIGSTRGYTSPNDFGRNIQ